MLLYHNIKTSRPTTSYNNGHLNVDNVTLIINIIVPMQKPTHFDLNVDQVAKLNRLLPKGYKFISLEDNNKRLAQLKKISKITYVPIA